MVLGYWIYIQGLDYQNVQVRWRVSIEEHLFVISQKSESLITGDYTS